MIYTYTRATVLSCWSIKRSHELEFPKSLFFSNRDFAFSLCRAALVLAADLDVLVAQLNGIVIAALGVLVNAKLCEEQLVSTRIISCRPPAPFGLHSL